ncbi:MAG: hypothetical protein K2O40_09915 [Lachnospiraceae bacterium]|nr:hypothetical protein [Lachnospiraceae bacterium]
MQLPSMKNEEKLINNILFIYILGVAISGWAFVMIFLNGGVRECIFLLSGLSAILTKLLENSLGSRAKYVYACIPPVIGAITAAVSCTNDSPGYVCITHYYFVATLLLVPYYKQEILKFSYIVTVAVNTILMILFPAGFLKLHSVIGWIFTAIVYTVLLAACWFICYRTTMLFGMVEKKEDDLKNVLNEVQSLSEHLSTAGTTLSSISENESASAEELAATSEQLVESNRVLSSKTDESMENLSELREWESVVADNVSKVESSSRDLYEKSKENEKLLKDLHIINGEVSESMNTTNDITQRLSEAVQEIGVTLKLISDISNSINLLSLNASIEAARAGEAGRGFAVVASEVGNLAKSTQESLKVVESVIERVQQNVKEITTQVEENTTKIGTQNEYVANVIQCMRDMKELLTISANAISTMGDAHSNQAEVIKKTVTINEDIAESIRSENEQFNSINAMAESNANDTTNVAAQANAINDMVDKITQLLTQSE